MKVRRRELILAVTSAVLLTCAPASMEGYITRPVQTLGQLCGSTYVTVVRVEQVDRAKGVIIYRKVQDLKGKYPREIIRHAFDLKNTPAHNGPGDVPVRPDERNWKHAIEWAQVGKTAVMFTLKYDPYGDFGHTYIDRCWYATMCPKRDWDFWYAIYTDQELLSRWCCGSPVQLAASVQEILAGKESVVPVLAEYNKDFLATGSGKIVGLRVGLNRGYDPRNDTVPWHGGYLRPLVGMPGFTHESVVESVGDEVLGISLADVSGTGQLDLCLVGTRRSTVLFNAGESFVAFNLPQATGARAAVWADYDGDGKPDLLLATPTGPRLLTNLGGGQFRDDSRLLPSLEPASLTAAAWIDFDDDGRPDILLANGYHGLRLFRNKGSTKSTGKEDRWFDDVSTLVGLGPSGIGKDVKGDTLSVCDVDGDGRPDFLYGAGTGILVRNTAAGFVQVRDSGIRYVTGKVGPAFADFDNSGAPSLLVPQLAGGCKLFKNDGTGRFTDITAQTGDLARFRGMATCAAWGDLDNDGRLDLVVGCLRGPNVFFRNKGDGIFEDASAKVGLHKRIFNTQGISLADVNQDGVLDLICNNQGQDAVVLYGNRDITTRKNTCLTIDIARPATLVGNRVRLLEKTGKLLGSQDVGSSHGRGGQLGARARFVVPPGAYRVEILSAAGVLASKDLTVGRSPVNTTLTVTRPPR